MSALIELDGRRLAVTWSDQAVLKDIKAVCQVGAKQHVGGAWTGDSELWTATCGPFQVSLAARVEADRVTLSLEVTAREAAEVTRVGLACRPELAGEAPGWWIYNGYQSWDAADVIKASAARRSSWWTCAVADVGGSGIAVASESAARLATRFDFRDGELSMVQCAPTGAAPIIWSAQPGDTLRLESLVATASSAVWAALKEVASGEPRRAAVPVGWLSWYHYGPWVSEQDVIENSRILADGLLRGLGYNSVQIDDGWQQAYGDWTPNTKFGSGLGQVAGKLAAAGQTAGVWTAPFLVSASADLAETAGDEWFVKDPISGERLIDPVHLSFGPMYVLDARRPAVCDHLEQVFRSLHDTGIRYFKIDFLYAGAYAGLEGLRAGVEAIRRGVGNSYILASGGPLQPLAGLTEGCRIGQDTATPIYDFDTGQPLAKIFGDEILWIARNIACRHFLDGWYQLDPDVALVGANLTLGQARQLVTAVALSGGPFFASDALLQLEPERLALLTNPDVLSLVGGPPAVPDWEPDSEQLASIWRRNDGVLAAFNWTGGPRRLVVDAPQSGGVRDLWTGQAVDLSTGVAHLELPEAGVRLLKVDGGGRLSAWLE